MPEIKSSNSQNHWQNITKSQRNRLFKGQTDLITINQVVSCEDIIFELARECQVQNQNQQLQRKTEKGSHVDSSHIKIKSDGICVTEEEGFALLHYGFEAQKGQDKNEERSVESLKIVTEEEDFIAFSICSNNHSSATEKMVNYENWGKEKLQSHLGVKDHLRCKLQRASVYGGRGIGGEIVALVLAVNASEVPVHTDLVGQEVHLPHQFDQGHAFVGDEVLVQLKADSQFGHLSGQVFNRIFLFSFILRNKISQLYHQYHQLRQMTNNLWYGLLHFYYLSILRFSVFFLSLSYSMKCQDIIISSSNIFQSFSSSPFYFSSQTTR